MRIIGVILATLLAQQASAQLADVDWWKTTTIYQVYPRSFKDTNADGIGDLKGITLKLDHFVDIGIGGLLLSPVFKSPMKDFGYDVSDFREIDPIFGTMVDFEELVQGCKDRGLKLVLELVPNHSSDEHVWFTKSIAREDPFTDYYTWRDPKGLNASGHPIPPNNWLSVFGGSAWEYNKEREQFYLHQFLAGQPDLNYRNPRVTKEMDDILGFWMDKGADGFRLNAMPHLMEDQTFPDEPPSNDPEFTPDQWGSLSHIYTTDLPELYSYVFIFRKVIDSKQEELGRQMVMMVEAYTSLENTMKYYGDEYIEYAHFPFNFEIITNVNNKTTASELKAIIDRWQNALPSGAWSNWVIGNHDRRRVASRFGRDFSTAVVIMGQLLPGTAITYNGEEINMEDTWISWADTVDPQGCQAGPEFYEKFTRDPVRTPYQWDDSAYAGFTTANSDKPWLPVNDNYRELNLAAQKLEENSPYAIYKKLTAMRKDMNAVRSGQLGTSTVGDDIFVFTRYLQSADEKNVLVVVNLAENEVNADLSGVPTLKSGAMITYHVGVNSSYTSGQELSPSSVNVPARGSLVFLYTNAASTTVLASLLLVFSVILSLLH
ncbi:maltase A1-like [Cloeon dipterum]|uniref:maltase A1-like n=1 Tax=Cloeon dipterum TaxID=197152 RepID=UPI00321FAEC2